MINLIVTGILVAVISAIVFYLYREKKRGTRCIGCPYGKQCTGCKGHCTDDRERSDQQKNP